MTKQMALGIVAAAGLFAFGMAGVVSCSGSAKPASKPPSSSLVSDGTRRSGPRPGAFGRHWVHEAKVRALMQQMARGKASWPENLPEDPEDAGPTDPDRVFADAAALADLLARAASDLPRAVEDRPLADDRREGFAKGAQALRRHAIALKEGARDRKVERMQRALDQINTACFACHSQYRDLAGELNRASLDSP